MRPEFAVIPGNIIRYCMCSVTDADAARYRYPLLFQALRKAVIPAVSAPVPALTESGIATVTHPVVQRQAKRDAI